MFEKIVLRSSEETNKLTLGTIAEAMFYYDHVHLILDWNSLGSLLKQTNISTLLSLLRRKPNLSAVYCEELLVIHSSGSPNKLHEFIGISISGVNQKKLPRGQKHRLAVLLERCGVKASESVKYAQNFLDLVPVRKLTGDYFVTGGVSLAATQDLYDDDFLREVARQSLNEFGITLPDNFTYQASPDNGKFKITTNLNFSKINEYVSRTRPDFSPLTPESVALNTLTARADIALASFYGGDFQTSSLNSKIIRTRHDELLRRSAKSAEQLLSFHEIALSNCPSLSQVIDSGDKSIDDFLRLLDKSKKFHSWIRNVHPDENLVRTYVRDINSGGSWLSSIPGKTLRYVLGSAIGAINPGAGAIFGAADSFLLDKISGGWRPNHFINSKLEPFLRQADD